MSTATPLQASTAKAQPSSNSTHAGLLLQRKCACGSPASSLTGECAECKSTQFLQAKLAIGASNDPLEQEADWIADQVMAAPAHSAVSGAPPHIQRFSGQSTGQADTAPASVDHALASPGRPLEPALRQDMEQRFGHDFSRVRVHSGAASEKSARDVNAHAYTAGHDIVFGAGRFAPGTHEGRRLIAHELTHVVQQSCVDGIRLDQGGNNRGLSPIYSHALGAYSIGHAFQTAEKSPSRSPGHTSTHGSMIIRQVAPGNQDILPPTRTEAEMRQLVREFYGRLPENVRVTIAGWKTIAFAEVQLGEEPLGEEPHLRIAYAVSGNANPDGLEAYARTEHNMIRVDYDPPVKGRGDIGSPGHAEQLLEEGAPVNDMKVVGRIVASRDVCGDCGVHTGAVAEPLTKKPPPDEGAPSAKTRGRPKPYGQRGSATVGGRIFTLISIGGIVYAISSIETLDDALEVAASTAMGAGTFAGAKALSGSSPIGFVVSVVVTMPSDQGAAYYEKLEQREKKFLIEEFLEMNFSRDQIDEHGDVLREEAAILLFETEHTTPEEILEEKLQTRIMFMPSNVRALLSRMGTGSGPRMALTATFLDRWDLIVPLDLTTEELGVLARRLAPFGGRTSVGNRTADDVLDDVEEAVAALPGRGLSAMPTETEVTEIKARLKDFNLGEWPTGSIVFGDPGPIGLKAGTIITNLACGTDSKGTRYGAIVEIEVGEAEKDGTPVTVQTSSALISLDGSVMGPPSLLEGKKFLLKALPDLTAVGGGVLTPILNPSNFHIGPPPAARRRPVR